MHGPRLGDLEAGAVDTWTSTQFAVISGGLAVTASAVLIALAIPAFVRYDTRE